MPISRLRQQICGEKLSSVVIYDEDILCQYQKTGTNAAGPPTPNKIFVVNYAFPRIFRPITSWMLTRDDLIRLMMSQLSGALVTAGSDMYQNKKMYIRSWRSLLSFTNEANTSARVRIYKISWKRPPQNFLVGNSYVYSDPVPPAPWTVPAVSLLDDNNAPYRRNWGMWATPVSGFADPSDTAYMPGTNDTTIYGFPRGLDMTIGNHFEAARLSNLALSKMPLTQVFPDITKLHKVTKIIDKVLRPGKTASKVLRHRVPRELCPTELLAQLTGAGAYEQVQKYGGGGTYTYFLFAHVESLGALKMINQNADSEAAFGVPIVPLRVRPPTVLRCRHVEKVQVFHEDGRKRVIQQFGRFDNVDAAAYDFAPLTQWYPTPAESGFNGFVSDFTKANGILANTTTAWDPFTVRPVDQNPYGDSVCGQSRSHPLQYLPILGGAFSGGGMLPQTDMPTPAIVGQRVYS